MVRMFTLFIIPILLSGILTGCSSKSEDSSEEVKPRATVEVAEAHLGDIDATIDVTGAFQVLRDEKVKSTISGKVEKVYVLEGDKVKKGELLATVLSNDSYAAIEGARDLLSRAENESEKIQAEEALKLAESTAATAKIRAPFSGAVTSRFVTEGELVAQGTDLVEIVDPKSEYFLANVPIDQVSSIRAGEPVAITIPGMGMSALHGTVQAVNPSTNPNTQSVEVRVGINSIPPLVAAGTFGNAQIKIGERRSVVLVPKPAVYHNDDVDKYYVWRIQGDSIALLTQVKVGLSDSSRIQISSGLEPGDIVATVGQYGLPDSTDVTVAAK